MSSKTSSASLIGFIVLPVIGLFLLQRRQGQVSFWNIVLLVSGIAYLVLVSKSFPNLYFGIVVAHVSFVSTLLWYSIMAGEADNDGADGGENSSVTSILAAICIPVIVFQIVASGSQIFENVSMEPCADLMRTWLAVAICLSVILLLGRKCYWRELNWFGASLDKRTAETTVSYMVMGGVASMIYPFFVSDFPNPIRILFCMLT